MACTLARALQLGDRLRWPLVGLFVVLGAVLAAGVPLSIATAVVLIGIAAAALNPAVSLAATLAAVPFIFHPVDVGGRSFTLLEIALVVTTAGLAARTLLDVVVERRLAPLMMVMPPRGLTTGAAILVAIALYSLTHVADPEHRDASVRAFRTVILEPLFILPAVSWALKRKQLDIALAALAAMVALCTIWGVGEVLTGSGVAADGVRRATGPYTHPNNLSFFLERATLLVAIPALFIERYRQGGWVVLGIGLLGVLATFSRGALIGLPAGIALALWLTGRLRAVTGLIAAVLALIGALALIAGDRLFDVGSSGSEPSRIVIWRAAIRMLRDFPISGIGLDQFYVMYGLRYIEPVGWPERYTSHPHNIALDAWLSLGVLGLALLVLSVAWLAWRTIRLRAMPKDPAMGLAIGGAAALAAGFVHGLVDNAFFLPDLAVLTWFSAALLIGAQTRTGEDGEA